MLSCFSDIETQEKARSGISIMRDHYKNGDDNNLPNPNKISSSEEGPIDNVILCLSAGALPIAHKLRHTPNILTTYSFVCGLGALIALWNRNAKWFAVLWSIGYFFDCMDGQMARRYNIASRFGDYCDHATDILTYIGFIAVVLIGYSHVIMHRNVLPIGSILVLFTVLSTVHIGCQQQRVAATRRERGETLDILTNVCPTPSSISWTRYFSTGTTNLILVVFGVLLVNVHNKSFIRGTK